MNKKFVLNGYLEANLNGFSVHIEAKDNHIQIKTSSFKALRKLFNAFQQREIKNKLPLSFIENSLSVSYFINENLVAYSGFNVPVSWYGKYLGMNHLKIKTFNLLKALF